MRLSDRINKFAELLTKSIESYVQAGQELVKMVKEDPKVFEKINEKHPWLTFDMLNGILRVGKGEVYPYLLLDQSYGARKLMELPIDQQKKLYDAQIAVAVNKRGEVVTETKRIQEMSRREVEVALCEKGVRPIAEQRKIVSGALKGPNVFKRSMFDPNPDDETPSNDEPDAESESIDENLSKAQAAILKVREILGEKNTPKTEKHITNALNAIGGLRFELKEERSGAQICSRMLEAALA